MQNEEYLRMTQLKEAIEKLADNQHRMHHEQKAFETWKDCQHEECLYARAALEI